MLHILQDDQTMIGGGGKGAEMRKTNALIVALGLANIAYPAPPIAASFLSPFLLCDVSRSVSSPPLR